MNLADAIRKAAMGHRAQQQPPTPAASESPAIIPHSHVDDGEIEIDAEMLSAAAAAAAAAAASFESGSFPDPIQQSLSQNAIRLELFVTPEQMNSLLRAVTSSHHSVMTLREAAAYLRMTVGTLEKMAQDHDVPAFVIDGRWRFPKPALDEWLAIRALRVEEDVA